MTRTGRTLAEYADMGAAGVVALVRFVRWVEVDRESAVWMSGHPDRAALNVVASSREMTNSMVADLIDLINALRAESAAKGSGRRPRYPKPFKRPWAEREGGYGKGAMSVSDFDKWWKG